MLDCLQAGIGVRIQSGAAGNCAVGLGVEFAAALTAATETGHPSSALWLPTAQFRAERSPTLHVSIVAIEAAGTSVGGQVLALFLLSTLASE